MRRRQTLILAVGVAALSGCGTDTLTAPRPNPKMSNDCSTQLYYDPTNCTDFGSGGYTYTDATGYGSAEVVFTFAGPPPAGVTAGVPAVCPAFYKALVPATLNPVGGTPLTIISTGYFIPTTPVTLLGKGTYTWPAGWWPSTDGSGREANISTADAVCFFGPTSNQMWTIYVNFYYFVGQIRQGTSGGSGGGGGSPGGAACTTEFITVEVDNGSGWTTFWSGYATVCS